MNVFSTWSWNDKIRELLVTTDSDHVCDNTWLHNFQNSDADETVTGLSMSDIRAEHLDTADHNCWCVFPATVFSSFCQTELSTCCCGQQDLALNMLVWNFGSAPSNAMLRSRLYLSSELTVIWYDVSSSVDIGSAVVMGLSTFTCFSYWGNPFLEIVTVWLKIRRMITRVSWFAAD